MRTRPNKLARRRHCSNPKRIPDEIWKHVIFYLELQWSPKHIASRVSVSLHSIYHLIRQDKNKGGTLFHHLRFRNQNNALTILDTKIILEGITVGGNPVATLKSTYVRQLSYKN